MGKVAKTKLSDTLAELCARYGRMRVYSSTSRLSFFSLVKFRCPFLCVARGGLRRTFRLVNGRMNTSFSVEFRDRHGITRVL